MSLWSTSVSTPIGRVTALLDETGICALGFTDSVGDVARWLLPARRGEAIGEARPDPELSAAIEGYFDGHLRALDSLVVSPSAERSGAPGRAVAELRSIAPGTTITYTELARRARTGSPRVAGAGCATNPVSLVIPCHRVIGSDGSLRGYGWGLERKAWLLAHEARHA